MNNTPSKRVPKKIFEFTGMTQSDPVCCYLANRFGGESSPPSVPDHFGVDSDIGAANLEFGAAIVTLLESHTRGSARMQKHHIVDVAIPTALDLFGGILLNPIECQSRQTDLGELPLDLLPMVLRPKIGFESFVWIRHDLREPRCCVGRSALGLGVRHIDSIDVGDTYVNAADQHHQPHRIDRLLGNNLKNRGRTHECQSKPQVNGPRKLEWHENEASDDTDKNDVNKIEMFLKISKPSLG